MKKLVKTRVQRVILAVFTLFTFLLYLFHLESGDAHGQRNRRDFVEGWNDPEHHIGHGTRVQEWVTPVQEKPLKLFEILAPLLVKSLRERKSEKKILLLVYKKLGGLFSC